MEEIADGVFTETEYEGVNVGAVVTDNGIICIDTPTYPRDARDWVTQVDRLSARSVRHLIITDSNGDRLLNTRWINAPIIAHQSVAERLSSYEKRYPQNMLDSLVQRNQVQGRELSPSPVDRAALSFSSDLKLFEGGRVFQVLHVPGPTRGSSWIKVLDAGVLFTGDSVVVGTHPPLADLCIDEWIKSLEDLQNHGPEVKMIFPGRGQMASTKAIKLLEDYLIDIRETLAGHIAAGQSKENLAQYVGRFLPRFPFSDLPYDWLQQQILRGLERAYEEILRNTEKEPVP